jgi:hypothetical protein
MAVALIGGAARVVAQEAGDVRLRFSGRVQVQYSTSSVEDDEVADPVAGSTFETRRIRLRADVTVRDWIDGVLEPDFALGNVGLRRAYVDLGFDDRFALRMGQFKRPFNRLFLISSTETPTIERGLRIRGLSGAYALADAAGPPPVLGPSTLVGDAFELIEELGHADYELGAAVHGELGAFGYEVGVFNGTGHDAADENDAKSFAARGTVGIGSLPLSLGGAVSYREVGVGDESDGGTSFVLDAEWGGFTQPGLRVVVEGVTGENHVVDERFAGAHALVSWFHAIAGRRLEGIEPVGRVSWGDPNTAVDGDAGVLLTPGLTVYLLGRNKLSVNWDVFVPQGDRFETEHALRAQAQVAF